MNLDQNLQKLNEKEAFRKENEQKKNIYKKINNLFLIRL